VKEDFNIKVTVRNARLLEAIRKKYESVADISRKMGQHHSTVNSLVTMKIKPINEKGWTNLALDVAAMVGKEPENIWPKYMREIKLKKASSEVLIDLDGVKQIMADGSSEKTLSQLSAIKQFSAELTPRQRKLITDRFVKNQTLEQCAKFFGITKGRARQIEGWALRKMKQRAVELGYGERGKELFED
jgi:RNA polymerase sigma factor (sigma-70 family)